jgi:hypothetical protein
MKVRGLLIFGLALVLARVGYAAPSIVDFNDVYYEGYPNTGGFVAHNASSLAIRTPSGVTAGDNLYILTTGIPTLEPKPTVATIGPRGQTSPWFAVRNLDFLASDLGVLYAFTSSIKTTQMTPLSVRITLSSPSNINAIIFEVTGGGGFPPT